MIKTTLNQMTKGGIWDLVDGGFCRYSVDEKWLVPHFEKMLYDNAMMLRVFVEAFKIFDDTHYKLIALQIAEFVENFLSKNKLFYSTSDADSEGEEGKYFVYTYDEVYTALQEAGIENPKKALAELSISPYGNFEDDKNIVRIEKYPPKEWKKIRTILQDLRKKRTYPFRDQKIQTSWNAMYIDALFELGAIEPNYIEKAKKSLKKLQESMFIDGKLYHTTILGKKPKVEAFLEDVAFLAKAYLSAYEKTFDELYLIEAQRFVNTALIDFYDKGVWYFSKGEFQTKAEIFDAAYTSSVSVMVENLLTLASLFGDEKYRTFAFKTLEYNSYELSRKPIYYPSLFNQMMRYLKKDYIIKAKADKLRKNLMELSKINYPYTLLKSDEVDGFLICGLKSCFSNVNDAKIVSKEIDRGARDG